MLKISPLFVRKTVHRALVGLVALFSFWSALAIGNEATLSPQQLLNTTLLVQQQSEQANSKRVSEFARTEQQLIEKRDALARQVAQLEQNNNQRAEQFQLNEQRLLEQEQALTLATGTLGELFSVVRQGAKDLQQELEVTVSAIGLDGDKALVDDIVGAKTLPSKSQLYGFWQALATQIKASGEWEAISVQKVDGGGAVSEQQVYRLGSIGLFDSSGYLSWDGLRQQAFAYPVQPKQVPTSDVLLNNEIVTLSLDPSRGQLLEQLGNVPTWQQRLAQGGIVGKIILGMLVIGLVIGLLRGTMLFKTHTQIRAQLNQLDQPNDDNPLGRVLKVYQEDKDLNIEALELRLLETIVDEQQYLERGLSMLKLLAALAPMLGLLGTVTGMIDTFQTITDFGNADPKIMAGGISMALITTVLGLIAAMPLLLLHNMLSTQAETIRVIIEKQGIGMVAQRAEKTLSQRLA